MPLEYTISYDLENGISIVGISKTVRENKGKNLVESIDDYILETTGLDPKYVEIIEIATVKFRNGVKVSGFTTLIKPENKIDERFSEDK